jgi:alginate O-acetyltransferase complex protein AlgI
MISLVCDVHARKYPAPGFVDYCLYLSFFPQILAGPIVRGDQMLPQLARHPRERVTDFTGGLYAFVLGLFFKAVIADHISDAIDPCWTDAAVRGLSTLDAWCVALLYSAQIFADFGGYSFMAIGLGKILGFELPTNFDAPYLSASFQEFWHRWHITLSSFLRDYLFIGALGGSRVAAWRIPVNLIVTMLLGGLWHGPAWNFIAWGGLHGCALAIERSTGFTMKERRSALARGLWSGVVFLTVLVAWVMFRSPDLRFAIHFLGRMAGRGANNAGMHLAPEVAHALPLILPVLIYHLARARLPATALWQNWAYRGIATGALTYAILMGMHAPRGFIYFVF